MLLGIVRIKNKFFNVFLRRLKVGKFPFFSWGKSFKSGINCAISPSLPRKVTRICSKALKGGFWLKNSFRQLMKDYQIRMAIIVGR